MSNHPLTFRALFSLWVFFISEVFVKTNNSFSQLLFCQISYALLSWGPKVKETLHSSGLPNSCSLKLVQTEGNLREFGAQTGT